MVPVLTVWVGVSVKIASYKLAFSKAKRAKSP